MKRPSRILLLPMCGLGDAVCYVPFLRTLREQLPQTLITVIVVSGAARTILDMAGTGAEVIVYNRGGDQAGWRPLYALLKRIRGKRYDVVISGAHPNSISIPVFAFFSGAKVRVGARAERCGFLYNRRLDIRTDGHAYDRFRSLLTGVGITLEATSYKPSLVPPTDARRSADAIWAAAGIGDDDFIIGIASGADVNARGIWQPYLKRWPAANYAALARHLVRDLGAKVVMFGGSNEQAIADEISFISGLPLISLCGKTGICELTWLLSRCKAVVTNDTGIMHVAAAVGASVLGLFGPTSVSAFGPAGENVRALQGSIPCSPCYPHPTCDLTRCSAMEAISVEEVRSTLAEMLGFAPPDVDSSAETRQLVKIGAASVTKGVIREQR